jgi:hypothetical protein
VAEVSCEPCSAEFPVYQGKYREFLRFSDAVYDRLRLKPSVYAGSSYILRSRYQK